MEAYTLNRNFLKQDVIDNFSSIIWTERYYGDSEVELVVPVNQEMLAKLGVGTFLTINQSDEVMILESMNIEDGKLKLSGISLLPWLNNRFVRTSALHQDRYWNLGVIQVKPQGGFYGRLFTTCAAKVVHIWTALFLLE